MPPVWLSESSMRSTPSLPRDLRHPAVQGDQRLAARQDLDVPPDEPDDTDAQRLADSLLGGEARRVVRPRVGEAVAVGALLLAEEALVGARQALEQPPDARRLDHVDAEAEEEAGRRDRGKPSSRPYSTVTVFARFRGWSTFRPLSRAMW